MPDLISNNIKLLPPGHHHGHRLIIISGIIVSVLIIILALTIANSRTSIFGRAATTSTTSIAGSFSTENSYLFASPISAASDGVSIIRITVIILNDQGLGIANLEVNIKSSGGTIQVKKVSETTDTFGRAIFDLSSNAPGDHTISALVSGTSLPQTVSVVFR